MLFVDWASWLILIAFGLGAVAFVLLIAKLIVLARRWRPVFRIAAGLAAVPVALAILMGGLFAGLALTPDIRGEPIYSPDHSSAARPTAWGFVFAGGAAVDVFSWHGLLRERVFQGSNADYDLLEVRWDGDRDLTIKYPDDVPPPHCIDSFRVHVVCRRFSGAPPTHQTSTGTSSSTGEPNARR